MATDFHIVQRGQVVQAPDLNQYALAFGGNSSIRLLLTQHDDPDDYTAVIGNVDTTNGLALKVQYDVAGAPVSIARFDKVAAKIDKSLHVLGDQALFFDAGAGGLPDANTLFQLVKVLTLPGHILLDSTAYVDAVATATVVATASSGADDSPGPPSVTVSGTPWTNGAYANHAIRVTGGTGVNQWGLINASGVTGNNTVTLYPGTPWIAAVDATSTIAIYSKNTYDPSNVKVNTFIRDHSFADVRGLELHVESSSRRGQATQWGIELGVHPGVATTDGTDKIVGYVARVTPPGGSVGTQPAAAVNGDVAFMAYGGSVAGVTGSAGWRKYLKFLDSTDAVSYEVLGDGQVNLPKLSAATEPGTGLTGIYTLAANSRLYRFPNGGSQTQIADQITTMTLLDQQVGTGSSDTITFASIPATYGSLYLEIVGRSTNAGTSLSVRITFEGSPTVGAYNHQYITGNNTTVAGAENPGTSDFIIVGTVPGTGGPASAHGIVKVDIPEYANTSIHKGVQMQSISTGAAAYGSAALLTLNGGGAWESTAAISTIIVKVSAGNWATTTRARLWGRPAS